MTQADRELFVIDPESVRIENRRLVANDRLGEVEYDYYSHASDLIRVVQEIKLNNSENVLGDFLSTEIAVDSALDMGQPFDKGFKGRAADALRVLIDTTPELKMRQPVLGVGARVGRKTGGRSFEPRDLGVWVVKEPIDAGGRVGALVTGTPPEQIRQSIILGGL